MMKNVNSKRLEVLQIYLVFRLWQVLQLNAQMTTMLRKHGEHYDMYGNATKNARNQIDQ